MKNVDAMTEREIAERITSKQGLRNEAPNIVRLAKAYLQILKEKEKQAVPKDTSQMSTTEIANHILKTKVYSGDLDPEGITNLAMSYIFLEILQEGQEEYLKRLYSRFIALKKAKQTKK